MYNKATDELDKIIVLARMLKGLVQKMSDVDKYHYGSTENRHKEHDRLSELSTKEMDVELGYLELLELQDAVAKYNRWDKEFSPVIRTWIGKRLRMAVMTGRLSL